MKVPAAAAAAAVQQVVIKTVHNVLRRYANKYWQLSPSACLTLSAATQQLMCQLRKSASYRPHYTRGLTDESWPRLIAQSHAHHCRNVCVALRHHSPALQPLLLTPPGGETRATAASGSNSKQLRE
jgi:UDP-galactopyranose mutase